MTNKLQITGNITADPELRFLPSGAAIVSFTIADTPRVYDKETGEWKDGDALFLRCNLWRDAAENVAESLQRGARVVAIGELKQKNYKAKDGTERKSIELEVEEIGPSLKYATANVQKKSRSDSGRQPATVGAASTPSDLWGNADDAPPF